MVVVHDRRLEGERVPLGERGFERCRFVRCQLVFDGRPVHLVDNEFDACTWAFDGAAGVTLDFLAALCRDHPDLRAGIAGTLGLAAGGRPPRRRIG